MARPPGFEPGTHCLEGSCSIQLSYGRNRKDIQKPLSPHFNPKDEFCWGHRVFLTG